MAANKTSFVLYCNLLHTVKKMPIEKAGELFLTILEYVNDLNPVVNDILVDLVFEPVKQHLKRDLIKWENEKINKSIAGRIGGINSGKKRSNKLKIKQNEANEASASKTKQNEAEASRTKQRQANEAVNVYVNVNDNVNERDNAPEKENVFMVFKMQGGTDEMAIAYFNNRESVNWICRGAKIKNIAPDISNFIKNWKQNLNSNGLQKNNGSVGTTGRGSGNPKDTLAPL